MAGMYKKSKDPIREYNLIIVFKMVFGFYCRRHIWSPRTKKKRKRKEKPCVLQCSLPIFSIYLFIHESKWFFGFTIFGQRIPISRLNIIESWYRTLFYFEKKVNWKLRSLKNNMLIKHINTRRNKCSTIKIENELWFSINNIISRSGI